MGMAQDYIDLIASGDEAKIKCVLAASAAGAATGGVAAGLYFAPANAVPVAGTAFNASAAAVGAVLGALVASKAAYNRCGGAKTRGNLQRTFSQGKAPRDLIDDYETNLTLEYGLTSEEARLLSQMAIVFHSSVPDFTPTEVPLVERRQAVSELLRRMSPA